MKKILILSFTLFFLLSILIFNKKYDTYAFEDCHNKRIDTNDVSTLNLEKYIHDNNYELLEFCSFDVCYKKREASVFESINNFKVLFNKYLSEDEYYELNIKGYPITRIYVNNC